MARHALLNWHNSALALLLGPLLLGSPDISKAQVVSSANGGRVIHNSFFGMHLRYGTTRTPWPWVKFGSWRIIMPATEWRGLEPQRGQWNFTTLDRAVALAEDHGIDVVLTLGQTPTWAASRPKEIVPNGPGASSEPANFKDWETYIRKVATRYRGKIKYYELWNEPRFREVDPYRVIAGFTGTAHQMVELGRIAKRVLSEVDPQAKLLSPAFDAGFAGIPRVKAWFKAGGGTVSDILSYHFYLRPPERMVKLYRELRSVMKEAGYADMPLWNTESGYLVQNPQKPTNPQWPGTDYVFAKVLSPEQMAAYVVRSHVLMAAAGLDRFYWYSWDILNMGLTRKFGSEPTAASRAYGTMVRWLRGATIDACKTRHNNNWVCDLKRYHRKAWIIWSVDHKRTWNIPTTWKAVDYEGPYGVRNEIKHGQVTITTHPILLKNSQRPWILKQP